MSQSSGDSQKEATPEKTVSEADASSPSEKAASTTSKKTSSTKRASGSKKSTAKKNTSKKPAKPVSKKMTLAEMQSSLKSLETRMKRADTLTRKSVKTLEEVVESLDARTQKDNDNQKSALSQRVGRLSSDLEEGLATTRAEIKAALASALANPNPNPADVETAVAQAMSRLNDTETQQAQAIAKINRHLANLAKAVEDRLATDQIAATEALHRVQTQLSDQIESVETESAKAIGSIGGKVATLSEALEARQSRIDASLTEKVSDLAARTQAEFDKKTNSMEERIKTLEMAEREAALQRPDGMSAEIAANVSALSGQIETLQSRLDDIDASFTALQAQTDIMGQDLVKTQVQLQDTKSQNLTAHRNPALEQESTPPPPYPSEQATQTPRPHAAPNPARVSNVINMVPASQPSSNPYSQSASGEQSAFAAHEPIEFDPSSYHQSNPYSQPNMPQMMQQSAATAFAQPEFAPELMPESEEYSVNEPSPYQDDAYSEETYPYEQYAAQNYQDVESMPAGDPLLPYADPAYAETGTQAGHETIEAVRIGEPDKSRKSRRKDRQANSAKSGLGGSSLFTARNLRVAALATGLTLVTLFMVKSFLTDSSENPVTLQSKPSSPSVEQSLNQPSQAPDLPPRGPLTPEMPVSDASTPEGSTSESMMPEAPAANLQNASQAEPTPPIGTYEDTAMPKISDEGISTLESAAQKGDAVAQFQLGLSYLEQNRVADGVSLIRSASQTLPAAQYRLAKLYDSGIGVKKDTSLARDLTERAARAGNRIAMHDLAIYYAYGNGDVSVDMETAAGWFAKAAERGVVDSQFNLAILFENGQGVEQSLPDAYFWYAIAGEQGDQTAAARISALENQMPPSDIEAAKTRVANFRPVQINGAANGIFKDLPWSKVGPSAAAQTKAEIKEAQILLTDMGFEIGAADGIMGERTRNAILGFQRANNLSETGLVNGALLDRLENASRA